MRWANLEASETRFTIPLALIIDRSQLMLGHIFTRSVAQTPT